MVWLMQEKFIIFFKLTSSIFGFGPKKYKNCRIEIDNANLIAKFSGWGDIPLKQMKELSEFDPNSFPPKPINIKDVKVDINDLVNVSFQNPPYFVFSQLDNINELDTSLFVQGEKILWRFLCENSKIGFRTSHIDAQSGKVVLNKLDKYKNYN